MKILHLAVHYCLEDIIASLENRLMLVDVKKVHCIGFALYEKVA